MAKGRRGIAIVSAGMATIFVTDIPIIWIGAFIWGVSMIYSGRKQWSEITKLDLAQGFLYPETQFVDSKPTDEELERVHP
jgi:hypothetical protein